MQLNRIATFIINTFEEEGLDKYYIFDKKNLFLTHDSVYETLLWANNLDPENTEVLAQKMGCCNNDLANTINFLRKYC
ncbi:hypothetical protein [Colwellia psychrerythraea]|uniref:Uncharacterized protein n=1 Tax=Colwellia psychrerythraea TaxID=28229 RepID=A0A099KZG4_COLPS|nr:hypothetical protein [Colwellia psychrerythraea]KGJ95580.1 hypothetical protein ND2E_1362 [Colwellia psychrerythraea]